MSEFAETWRRRRACERCRKTKVRCEYENQLVQTCIRCKRVGAKCEVAPGTRGGPAKAPSLDPLGSGRIVDGGVGGGSFGSSAVGSGPIAATSGVGGGGARGDELRRYARLDVDSAMTEEQKAFKMRDLEAVIDEANRQLDELRLDLKDPDSGTSPLSLQSFGDSPLSGTAPAVPALSWPASTLRRRDVVETVIRLGLVTTEEVKSMYEQFAPAAVSVLHMNRVFDGGYDKMVKHCPIIVLTSVVSMACATDHRNHEKLLSFLDNIIIERTHVEIVPSIEIVRSILLLVAFVQARPARKLGSYLTLAVSQALMLDLGNEEDLTTLNRSASLAPVEASPVSTVCTEGSKMAGSSSSIPTFMSKALDVPGSEGYDIGSTSMSKMCPKQDADNPLGPGRAAATLPPGTPASPNAFDNKLAISKDRVSTYLMVSVVLGGIAVSSGRPRLFQILPTTRESANALQNSNDPWDKVLSYSIKQLLLAEEAVNELSSNANRNLSPQSLTIILDRYKRRLEEIREIQEVILPRTTLSALEMFSYFRSIHLQILLILNDSVLNQICFKVALTDNTLIYPLVHDIETVCRYLAETFIDGCENSVILPKYGYIRSLQMLTALVRLQVILIPRNIQPSIDVSDVYAKVRRAWSKQLVKNVSARHMLLLLCRAESLIELRIQYFLRENEALCTNHRGVDVLKRVAQFIVSAREQQNVDEGPAPKRARHDDDDADPGIGAVTQYSLQEGGPETAATEVSAGLDGGCGNVDGSTDHPCPLLGVGTSAAGNSGGQWNATNGSAPNSMNTNTTNTTETMNRAGTSGPGVSWQGSNGAAVGQPNGLMAGTIPGLEADGSVLNQFDSLIYDLFWELDGGVNSVT